MPNSATQLYHEIPELQAVLDFLGRCMPDGQQLIAHYQDRHERYAVKAACEAWHVQPVEYIPGPEMYGEEETPPGLLLDREAWLVLANDAMSLLAQELQKRLPAVNAALKLVPTPWSALELADRALAAWGTTAGMIALPGRTVFHYFASRYPSESAQRSRYAIIRNLGHALAYRENGASGFLLAKEGMQNFACHRDDWQNEMTSARSMLDEHLSLMLKIGLQMLEAGATAQLNALHTVLALAGDAPSLVRMQTLLETYEDHVTSYGPGQNHFRNKLLKNCLNEFQRWQATCSPVAREASSAVYRHSPTANVRKWKWVDSSVSVFMAAAGQTAPCAPPAAEVVPDSDGPVADGVVIPKGVTVANGAHVRVCAISGGSHLKPGTVLHGDVSIASHTRFDGPVTIMNNVHIGWGLTFGPGLIMTEGATISTFAVRCALPRGTRIGGSLRIGTSTTVNRNVSFGAENWIGDNVHIGENVRFGPCVKIDSGISIGANAWIKGHTRLIGNVPENTVVDIPAADTESLENTPSSPAYAVAIAGFTITKKESIRERPAAPRQPLASEFDNSQEALDDLPHEVGGTGSGPASMVATSHVRPPVPAGLQRKRSGDPIAGRPAKQARIELESCYQEAGSGVSPSNVPSSSADCAPEKPFGVPRLLNISAFMPLEATLPFTATASSMSWPDQQRLAQYALTIAPPEGHRIAMGASGGAGQAAGETAPDRETQRLAWHQSVTTKENQNALERSTRRVIRVPAEGPRDQRQAPEPQPAAGTLAPLHGSWGPTL